MALHYESVDPTDAVESVFAPCPLSSNGYCSLNGACRKGTCTCFSGYVGESCTNAVICPEDPTTCTPSTCDPVCLQSQNDVIVVSINGDDTQGTGQRMDTSATGTDPKAVKSIRRALEFAQPNQTILVYPGIFTGIDNCGVTIATSSLLIRGLRGQILTILDCNNSLQGMIIVNGPIRMVGLTLRNTYTATDGAGISVTSASVEMNKIKITNGNSTQNGGAIYAYQSQLTLINSELSNCFALAKGGAVMLDDSNLFLHTSSIASASARQGGGIYAQNSVTVGGDNESVIWNNTGTVNGGGICASGTFSGSMVNISHNIAPLGAGITVVSGSSSIAHVNIVANYGVNDGGGIALLNSANLVLEYSPILMNSAGRYGGGVYMNSNGTLENNVASDIFNCTAGTLITHSFVVEKIFCSNMSTFGFWLSACGGGFYAADWSHPIVNKLTIRSSSATVAGGCAAFSRSSAMLNNAVFDQCYAAIGGGVHADKGSRVLLHSASITSCTAASGAGIYINSSSIIGANDASSVINYCKADDVAGGVFITGSLSSLQFFDVMNCSANFGGGVFAKKAANANVTSVRISKNNARESGGGLYTQASVINVSNVAVLNNEAVVGGGMYAIDSILSGRMSINGNSGEQGGGAASLGVTTIDGATIFSNTASQRGGGLAVQSGVLILKSTTIKSCSAVQGYGGGISIVNATVKHFALNVQSCSSLRGGGIYAFASKFYQYPTEASTGWSEYAALLSQNSAEEYGGGVFVDGENTTISDTIVTNSNAPYGGGLGALNVQRCVVLNTNISFSIATVSGGGLFFGSGTNCTIRNSWALKNQAGQSGGGIMIQEATIYHSNLEIVNNVAPTAGGVHVNSSLLSASFSLWEDATTQRSRIDANVINPKGDNGANVLLTCTSTCTLSGSIISGAKLEIGQGGGIFVVGRGSAMISDSLVANNTAVQGGGIAISDAEMTILENVAVVGNNASDGGGGLWAGTLQFLPKVYLMSCVLYNNSAASYGGAISLSGVYVSSSALLVVANNAGSSDTGTGGGIYADNHATVIVNSSLFLSNDASIGGSIATVKASDIIFREGIITRDADRFFTETWQDLFKNQVGVKYGKRRIQNAVNAVKGDLIYLSDTESSFDLRSSFVTYGSADAGGGVYINANAYFSGRDSEMSSNTANARGGSLCASNSAQVFLLTVKIILSGTLVFVMLS
ncbi:hypothetical protein PHMEG_0002379 [Phytophthora megakarya]|uniref:EGF-like domain-containing protein n=1 Tax=Phytophthora megakarya TaxID=4795 RepID=A0A225X0L0_9STRA|nr:hypothetical protein PHMEG_0002379 [Phytophthora megakarya]